MRFEAQLAKQKALITSNDPLSVPEGFVAERKLDGMRCLVEIEADGTRLFSRTGGDLREAFPELCRLHEVLPAGTVLDGEIVIFDADGRDNLEALQPRIHAQGQKALDRSMSNPATIRFFDVLAIQGIDVRSKPLSWRKDRLFGIVGPGFIIADEVRDGETIPADWEGVIVKRLASPYASGKRNNDWAKIKFVNRATLRVTTITAGTGARASTFGALVVEDANGVPRGQVGSGFKADDLDFVMAWNERVIDGSDEELIVEVEYRFIGKNGLLVNTAFKGFREAGKEVDAL